MKTGVDEEKEFEKAGNGFAKPATEELRRKASLVADLLTIKMNNLRPWSETKKGVLSDTTEEILKSGPVEPSSILVLTHVSAKEATNAPTTLQIAVERGGETLVLNRDVPSAADVSVDWDGQVILVEGDRVKVSFFVGTATNIIDVSMHGYIIKA